MPSPRDTKQLVILKRLTTHLEGVTLTNGYDFDLTGKVFRGQSRFGQDQPLPFVSILESLRPDPRPREGGEERLRRIDIWELALQGWVNENREFPTDDLYRLKGAVEMRMAEIAEGVSPAYRLGGLIDRMRIGPGVVRAATPQTGGAEAFYLPLQIHYVINLADPYAL